MTSLIGLRDWCVIYRPDTNFDDVIKNWNGSHQSSYFVKETYFGKFQGLKRNLRSCFKNAQKLVCKVWTRFEISNNLRMSRSYRGMWSQFENVPNKILSTWTKFHLNSSSECIYIYIYIIDIWRSNFGFIATFTPKFSTVSQDLPLKIRIFRFKSIKNKDVCNFSSFRSWIKDKW